MADSVKPPRKPRKPAAPKADSAPAATETGTASTGVPAGMAQGAAPMAAMVEVPPKVDTGAAGPAVATDPVMAPGPNSGEPVPDLSRPIEPPPSDAPPAPPARSEPPRRGGGGLFLAALLGGVIAAVIGFALARYVVPEGWPSAANSKAQADLSKRLDDESAQIAALKDQIGKLSGTVASVQQDAGGAGLDKKVAAATQGLDGKISDLGQKLSDRNDAQDRTIAQLQARIKSLESAPAAAAGQGGDTPASGTADAAEMQSLKQALAAQQSRNDAMQKALQDFQTKATGQIEANAKQAGEVKDAAQKAAQAALARAALTQVQTALEIGGPFAPALSDLEKQGVKVPDPLKQAAAKGVAPQATLQAEFPEAARRALDASIKANMGDGAMSRIGAFLRTQTGIRSLEPRAGKSPDAVLSRAEADVKSGKLPEALQEIATLPKPGQDALSDWTAKAKTRVAAIQAAQGLSSAIGQE